MTRRAISVTAFASLAIAAAMLGGCGGPRHDLTPEMMTLAQRPDDVENINSLTYNENWRMFWGDLARATLTDRPSRLTPQSVPH